LLKATLQTLIGLDGFVEVNEADEFGVTMTGTPIIITFG
jgi:hypothetical protein